MWLTPRNRSSGPPGHPFSSCHATRAAFQSATRCSTVPPGQSADVNSASCAGTASAALTRRLTTRPGCRTHRGYRDAGYAPNRARSGRPKAANSLANAIRCCLNFTSAGWTRGPCDVSPISQESHGIAGFETLRARCRVGAARNQQRIDRWTVRLQGGTLRRSGRAHARRYDSEDRAGCRAALGTQVESVAAYAVEVAPTGRRNAGRSCR